MSCEHGNHIDGCEICDAIDAAYKSGYVAGGIAALKAPEASGADYVLVPREQMEEWHRTLNVAPTSTKSEIWTLLKANPAPPTSGDYDGLCPCCGDIECAQPTPADESGCSQHPDAPHGFDRNGSHNAGRYVCDCEAWTPGVAELVVRDVCELDPADPEGTDTVCIRASDLRLIVERHAARLTPAPSGGEE